MEKKSILSAIMLAACAFCAGCADDDLSAHHFDDRVFISSSVLTRDLYISPENIGESRAITVRMAAPAAHAVDISVDVRPELVLKYDQQYNDRAFLLPENNYRISSRTVRIEPGMLSNDIVIDFIGIDKLDKNDRYVLPVEIVSCEGAPLLASRSTAYFLLRGPALINVVADISESKAEFAWGEKVRDEVQNMRHFTLEALLYCTADKWEDGRDNALSTLFGIEGKFLIRVGDSDRPRDQLQVVYEDNDGAQQKWPAANEVQGLPVGKWVHVAIVFDASNKSLKYYIDGSLAAETYNVNLNSVDLTASPVASGVELDPGCWIGYSYDDTRYLPCRISELRLWRTVRTEDEISRGTAMYSVDSWQYSNLIGYWKFDEGTGNTVRDHTGNGTDLTFGTDIVWEPEELPIEQ